MPWVFVAAMLGAAVALLRSLGVGSPDPFGVYCELAARALEAMGESGDVVVRLLYGRWLAEVYVCAVYDVFGLELAGGLAADIYGLPRWGWEPAMSDVLRGAPYVREYADIFKEPVWVLLAPGLSRARARPRSSRSGSRRSCMCSCAFVVACGASEWRSVSAEERLRWLGNAAAHPGVFAARRPGAEEGRAALLAAVGVSLGLAAWVQSRRSRL